MDLATLTQASGILVYRGLTLESKEGIFVDGELDTFDLQVDGFGDRFDRRTSNNGLTIRLTPSGAWGAHSVLFPYLSMPEGQFAMPSVPVSINTSTDVLTATAHPLRAGDRVLIGARPGGTLPQVSSADVDPDTYYYVGTVTANTFKLYTSRGNAFAEASAVNFSGAGTYVRIVAQWDAVLHTVDGRKITFHACALEGHPDLDMQREATPFGEITLRAYCRSRKKPSDANAFYTEAEEAFPGWTLSASDILTQAQWVAWANMLAVDSIDIDSEELSTTDHGLTTEAKVYPGTSGTFPTASPALNSETPLYARVVDSSTITLHTSAAGATANTGKVTFSAAGTGVLFLTVDNPPFSLMDTEGGVQISSDVSLEDKTTDNSALYNKQFMGCDLTATLIPTSVSGSQVLTALKLQGSGAELGRSLGGSSRPLSIFSSGMFVRINGAALTSGQTEQSMRNTEARELTFVSTRVVTAGVKQPPGYVSDNLSATATVYIE